LQAPGGGSCERPADKVAADYAAGCAELSRDQKALNGVDQFAGN
jgi:hypothetical protein